MNNRSVFQNDMLMNTFGSPVKPCEVRVTEFGCPAGVCSTDGTDDSAPLLQSSRRRSRSGGGITNGGRPLRRHGKAHADDRPRATRQSDRPDNFRWHAVARSSHRRSIPSVDAGLKFCVRHADEQGRSGRGRVMFGDGQSQWFQLPCIPMPWVQPAGVDRFKMTSVSSTSTAASFGACRASDSRVVCAASHCWLPMHCRACWRRRLSAAERSCGFIRAW